MLTRHPRIVGVVVVVVLLLASGAMLARQEVRYLSGAATPKPSAAMEAVRAEYGAQIEAGTQSGGRMTVGTLEMMERYLEVLTSNGATAPLRWNRYNELATTTSRVIRAALQAELAVARDLVATVPPHVFFAPARVNRSTGIGLQRVTI